ncbi:MAG: WD repeat-containing protein 49 [Caudoviricetes sp.]|nr:MAG: WD repeat-containing protein 49 [Caudoviricetes sp.]
MKGDKILKVYGSNTFMYEIEKGWVVPEFPPEGVEPEEPPVVEPEIPIGGVIEVIPISKTVLGYLDGNYQNPQKDPYALNFSTEWVEVTPNSKYRMIFNRSNRCYIQLKQSMDSSVGLRMLTKPKGNFSANMREFVTGANDNCFRIWFAEDFSQTDGERLLHRLRTE